MKLLKPSGMWILLGIPILIIIYIIKSKHEERAVSSTYIWKLSDRFMKQRVPLQKLRKALMFLLQLLLIVALALFASDPVLVKGEAIHYIVILDASASMQTVNAEGESRFDRAVESAEALAAELQNGHTVSVILAADSASCVVSKTDSEVTLKRALMNLSCTNGTADLEAAVEIAADLVDRKSTPQIMIFTDAPGGENENVSVVDLSEGERNITVSALSYSTKGREALFEGRVMDTVSETVTVGLKVDGKIKDARKLELIAGESTPVEFTSDITRFDTAELYVEVSDGLLSDNSYAVCRSGNYSAGVLILSESPTYPESVFSAQEDCEVTVAAPGEEVELSGYDLYIFDGVLPDEIPEDGSVIYLNTDTLPEGITVSGTVDREGDLTLPADASGLFFDELNFSGTVVSSYDTLSANAGWETLVLCGDEPVIMGKSRTNGLKDVVISFDLHDTNLTLQSSFVVLARNLIRYSVPRILSGSDFTVGDTVNLAVLPGAGSLYVRTPSGAADVISAKGLYGVCVPGETGIYTAVETTEKGGEYMDFFVHLPESEIRGAETVSGLSVAIDGERWGMDNAMQKIIFRVALIGLMLLLGEWGLYCYEQV